MSKKKKPFVPPPQPQPSTTPQQPPDSEATAEAATVAGAEESMFRELTDIYGADGEDRGDMSVLQRRRRSPLRTALVWIVVFLAVVAAAAWAAFFYLAPRAGGFTGDSVTVSIDAPNGIVSGKQTELDVRYRNGENAPLGTASIELRLPKEFALASTDPAVETGDSAAVPTILIGSVAPGKDGVVKVVGTLTAPLKTQLDFQAILHYRPADFNSEFQKVATRAVSVDDSAYSLTIDGPEKVLPGDNVDLTVTYKNTSGAPANGLELRGVFPQGFIPSKADPAATDDAMTTWAIPALADGAEGAVHVTGSFATDVKGPTELSFQLGATGGDATRFDLQKEVTYSTDVLEGNLVTSLTLNGQSADQPIAFGDTLRYSINWKNTGSATLEDVTIALTLAPDPTDAPLVQWSALKDKQSGVLQNGTITWTKDQVPALAKIGSQQEGTIQIEVPALAASQPADTGKTYALTATASVAIAKIDGAKSGRTAMTTPIVGTFSTDATLAGSAAYFNKDNIPVGTGPLPPMVGQATTYRVTWTIANSFHDLTDLRLGAKLPDNASWTGKSSVDAGDLRFDAAAGKMVWSLNWMPTTVKTLTISYDVALTPTADQVGKSPTLIDATILEATDKVTGAPVLLSLSPLTTQLDGDPGAAGKGKIVPAN